MVWSQLLAVKVIVIKEWFNALQICIDDVVYVSLWLLDKSVYISFIQLLEETNTAWAYIAVLVDAVKVFYLYNLC